MRSKTLRLTRRSRGGPSRFSPLGVSRPLAPNSSLMVRRPPPGATRLQREVKQLLALDVEYAHVQCLGNLNGNQITNRRRRQLPAQVCIIDYQGNVILNSYCNALKHEGLDVWGDQKGEWKFVGGVPVALWRDGPGLDALQNKMIDALGSRPVVGHNLGKDLAALGLDETNVPLHLRRDTMRFAVLQGPSGHGRSLQELAKKRLNRDIQLKSQRLHDPREDALASLDLYLTFCHFDTSLMTYDDLVEHLTAQVLEFRQS